MWRFTPKIRGPAKLSREQSTIFGPLPRRKEEVNEGGRVSAIIMTTHLAQFYKNAVWPKILHMFYDLLFVLSLQYIWH